MWRRRAAGGRRGDVLREVVAEAVRALDARGVVQSVASRTTTSAALASCAEAGLDGMFLFPQIGWNAKSRRSPDREALNLGLDAFAFVDDQDFELEEVGQGAARRADHRDGPRRRRRRAPGPPRPPTRCVTDESAAAAADVPGGAAASGTPRRTSSARTEEFLARSACVDGPAGRRGRPARAEELTVRTHQLNSTGYTYSYAELDALRTSSRTTRCSSRTCPTGTGTTARSG